MAKKRVAEGVQYARWAPGPPIHHRLGADGTPLLFALIAASFALYGDQAALPVFLIGLGNLLGALEVGSPLRPRKEDVSALLDDPCPVPQYNVDIVIRREEIVTAVDTGIVTFVDGWLIFHGLETSFSLSADRCKAVDPVLDTWWDLASAASFFLAVRIEGTPLDVSFRSRSGRDFRDELDEWLRERRSLGAVVAPPLASQPVARRMVRSCLLRAVAKGLLAAAIFAHLPFGILFEQPIHFASGHQLVLAGLASALAFGLLYQSSQLARYARLAHARLRRFTESTPPAFEPKLQVVPVVANNDQSPPPNHLTT